MKHNRMYRRAILLLLTVMLQMMLAGGVKAATLPEGVTGDVEIDLAQASVGDIIRVTYKINYEGKKPEPLKITADWEDSSGVLKMLYQSTQTSNYTTTTGGRQKLHGSYSHFITYKALKEGIFHTLPEVTVRFGEANLEVSLPVREIKVVSKDGRAEISKDRGEAEKQRIEAARKAAKARDCVQLVAELPLTQYQTGDTVSCRYYALVRVLDQPTHVTEAYSVSRFRMKNCEYWFVAPGDSRDSVESESGEEQVQKTEKTALDEMDQASVEDEDGEEENEDQQAPDIVEYRGLTYERYYLGDLLIVPSKPGIYTIPKIVMEGYRTIPKAEKNGYGGYMPMTESIKFKVRSQPVKFTVLEKKM